MRREHLSIPAAHLPRLQRSGGKIGSAGIAELLADVDIDANALVEVFIDLIYLYI